MNSKSTDPGKIFNPNFCIGAFRCHTLGYII